MPLPTTSSKAGHLKKHRTLCLTGFVPSTFLPPGLGKANKPGATQARQAQMRQAAGFLLPLQQLGPCLAGYPGLGQHPTIIVYGAQALQMSPVLWPHIQLFARTRVDKGPYRPWHPQNSRR